MSGRASVADGPGASLLQYPAAKLLQGLRGGAVALLAQKVAALDMHRRIQCQSHASRGQIFFHQAALNHGCAHAGSHGLHQRRKLLLVGPSGTGKTMTASALAGELGIPLFVVRLDVLITKFMGETASKLRQVFDAVASTRGVYFFDEFDAIGSQRGMANDVGEIRRILNSFGR